MSSSKITYTQTRRIFRNVQNILPICLFFRQFLNFGHWNEIFFQNEQLSEKVWDVLISLLIRTQSILANIKIYIIIKTNKFFVFDQELLFRIIEIFVTNMYIFSINLISYKIFNVFICVNIDCIYAEQRMVTGNGLSYDGGQFSDWVCIGWIVFWLGLYRLDCFLIGFQGWTIFCLNFLETPIPFCSLFFSRPPPQTVSTNFNLQHFLETPTILPPLEPFVSTWFPQFPPPLRFVGDFPDPQPVWSIVHRPRTF